MSFIASKISRLHLELTEMCNAACPLCIRTNPQGLRPQDYIGANQLRLRDIRSFFPSDFKRQLTDVHMCGSYGDPIVARDCLEIVDYFCSDSCAVSLSTNGSARPVSWWAEMGRILSRNRRSRIDFHIDGLADTNSYYRQNTNFDKIIENAVAFIEAGGHANWEFIPFRHNEHQLEQARNLSKQLNFARFTIKKSNWVFSGKRTRIPFTDRRGKTHYLEAPSTQYIPTRKGNRLDVLVHSCSDEIQCLALLRKELYISCEAIVYPCCWTARHARNIYLGRKTKDGFSIMFRAYQGRELFDLRQNRLDDMLKSSFFVDLAQKWQSGLPQICFKKCGRKNQPVKIKTFHGM